MYLSAASPLVQNNTIQSDTNGVYVTGGSTALITNTNFIANTIGLFSTGSTPNVNYSNFLGNPTDGVQNATAVNVVSATNNYWNASNGPGTVGPGTGDKVTTGVYYTGFLDNYGDELLSAGHLPLAEQRPARLDRVVTGTDFAPNTTVSVYSGRHHRHASGDGHGGCRPARWARA